MSLSFPHGSQKGAPRHTEISIVTSLGNCNIHFQIGGAFRFEANTDTAALNIKLPVTSVVGDGTLFRQRVSARTHGWSLLRHFILLVTKYRKN